MQIALLLSPVVCALTYCREGPDLGTKNGVTSKVEIKPIATH